MSTHDDEQGTGPDPRYGRPEQQYGQPPQYGTPGQPGPSYGGQQYQPSPYGQGQPHEQAGYPQQYGQQPGYGQYAPSGQYGQYGQYGYSAVPAKPGAVVVAAVLGFVFSALGALTALGLFAGGALFGDLVDDLAATDPTIAEADSQAITDAAVTFAIVFGVLALAWTALMVWGSVRALTGRSRVPLLVGGSIATAVTAFFLLVALSGVSTGGVGGGEVLFFLLFFLAALAIVVLLCLRPAAQFFAAHRARRAGR